MKYVKTALKLLFAAGLIYWLVASGRFDVQKLKPLFEPQFLAIGLVVVVLSMVILSERWRLILHSQGFELSFMLTLRLTLIGIFFNFAMPGGVGGDIIKGYYVVKSQPQKKMKSGLTILMDRVFGLYVIVLMAAAAIVYDIDAIWSNPNLRVLTVFVFALTLAYSFSLVASFSQILHRRFSPMAPEKFRALWDTLVTYGHNKKTLLGIFVLSLIAQLVFLGFFVMAGRQIGFQNVPVVNYFVACLIGVMATAIPISPAGIGVGQAAFAYLFAALAGPETSTLGASLASASQIYQFGAGLIGAYFYVHMGLSSQMHLKKEKA